MLKLYLQDKMVRKKCPHKISKAICRVCNSKAYCKHNNLQHVVALSVVGGGWVLTVNVCTIASLVVGVHGAPMV